MILDLRLPAGWTQAPIGAATAKPGIGTTRVGGAAGELGTIFWPAAEEGDTSPHPAALLLSPLLPILRSPTLLLQAALDSEPDYEVTQDSPYILVRLGPWEATLLETEGRSHETGRESARIYAVLDVGFGAFMLVFVDCDPTRLDLRREQLADILAQARLRREPRLLDHTDSADVVAASPASLPRSELDPPGYTLDVGLDLDEAVGLAQAAASEESPTDTREADPAEPTQARVQESSEADEGDLPTPPQRPAEDVYLGGVLFPHLVD